MTHNDARLLGDLDPPIVDHTHKTPIPTTVAPTNRQYRPIATRRSVSPNGKYIWLVAIYDKHTNI